MNNNLITRNQFISIFLMTALGSALIGANTIYKQQHIWLSLIIGGLILVPPIFLLTRILNLFKGQDIDSVFANCLSPLGGKLVLAIYTAYSFYAAIFTISDFTKFVKVVSLPQTPELVIALPLVAISAFIVKKGLTVFGRSSKIIVIFVIGIMVLSFSLSINNCDINNLFPILPTEPQKFGISCLQSFAFPYADTILLFLLYSNIKDKAKPFSTFAIGLGLSICILSLTALRNLLVLGDGISSALYYPTYQAVSVVEFGTFVQRSEAIVAAIYLFCYLTKLTVCLFVCCKCLTAMFSKIQFIKYAYVLGGAALTISLTLFNSTFAIFDFLTIYRYIAVGVQLILPFIIWIGLEIKTFKLKRSP